MSVHEQWQLKEGGPDSYERYQVPSVFEPLADLFLGHIGLQPGEKVLDVACGTGVLARQAAPFLGADGLVVGVDLNPGMLEVAHRRLSVAGLQPALRQGDAAALPFEDASFDVVLCQQGLQFFPDPLRALREMYRVLLPAGRLGLCVWQSIEHSPCNRAMAEALAYHVDGEAAERIQAPFALGHPNRLAGLVQEAGFGCVETHEAVITRRMLPPEQSIPGHLASTPLGPEIANLHEDRRTALIARISEALDRYRVPGGLAIPQGTLIVQARKQQ